jgi:hypothetical protein
VHQRAASVTRDTPDVWNKTEWALGLAPTHTPFTYDPASTDGVQAGRGATDIPDKQPPEIDALVNSPSCTAGRTEPAHMAYRTSRWSNDNVTALGPGPTPTTDAETMDATPGEMEVAERVDTE